jgi:hypothetical protein
LKPLEKQCQIAPECAGAAALERFVGGVDDGVHLLPGNVSIDDQQALAGSPYENP